MRLATVLFTGAILSLAACGGSDSESGSDDKAAATPTAAGQDLGAIKTYLLDHTQRLQGDVAALRENAQRYHDLAEQSGFDSQKLLADNREEVAQLMADAKETFKQANPAYREGFETVLFLQSLELSAGTAAVIEGAALGLALTLAVAVLTFVLQRKLPYKRMLIATGGLIGLMLVVMVGQTARTMQGTGWLPITPLDWELPSDLGL
jgi:Iron permease FTR1 family